MVQKVWFVLQWWGTQIVSECLLSTWVQWITKEPTHCPFKTNDLGLAIIVHLYLIIKTQIFALQSLHAPGHVLAALARYQSDADNGWHEVAQPVNILRSYESWWCAAKHSI